MKKALFLLLLILPVSCREKVSTDAARSEIFETEKAFEKMASEEGLAKAFYFFANDNAVIKRGNDSLVFGKENIRNFYEKNASPNIKLSWTPDFIEVSECGTLGYTYGKYIVSGQDTSGKRTERTGIFHTVWKKQNNQWRYVWD